MMYSAEQVWNAALVAYRSTLAGMENEDYAHSKADLFLRRCRQYDCDPNAEFISREAVDEIAYAALDSDCTARLYSVLSAMTR